MNDVSRIIIGTANFHPYRWDSHGRALVNDADAAAIIRVAANMGFAGVDSADGYGFGAAERTLASQRHLLMKMGPMAITTKVGYNFYNRRYHAGRWIGRHFQRLPSDAVVPFDSGKELSPDYLLFAAAQSHDRLDGMRMNLLIHCPELTELRQLRSSGTFQLLNQLPYVLKVGVSVKLPEEVFESLNIDSLGILQVPAATLCSRAMELALHTARQRNITVLVNQPFHGGREVVALARAARQIEPELSAASAAGLAARKILADILARDCLDYVVAGVSSSAQLLNMINAGGASDHLCAPSTPSRREAVVGGGID